MIKRTLFFGNPTWVNVELGQLVITDPILKGERGRVPIEDIGVVVLDHQQITLTHMAMSLLLENNAAVIVCNDRHMPTGLLLNLNGNTVQAEVFKHQIECSEPLKKQLWKQTVEAKLKNQAQVMEQMGQDAGFLFELSTKVQSGDTGNREAQGAAWYWPRVFRSVPGFHRYRDGRPPNNLLNYGYAILRAMVARSLVGSGLLPTLGIFHRNRYNAYALADDIMEPYRPWVDLAVARLMSSEAPPEVITLAHKGELLKLATADTVLEGKASPLLPALQRTTASLVKCFNGSQRRVLYPSFT